MKTQEATIERVSSGTVRIGFQPRESEGAAGGEVVVEVATTLIDPACLGTQDRAWGYSVGRVAAVGTGSSFSPGDDVIGTWPAASRVTVPGWRVTSLQPSIGVERFEFLPLIQEAADLLDCLTLPPDARILVCGTDAFARVLRQWIAWRGFGAVAEGSGNDRPDAAGEALHAVVLTSGDPADLLVQLPRVVVRGTAVLAGPLHGSRTQLHLYPDIHRREVRLVGRLRSFERNAVSEGVVVPLAPESLSFTKAHEDDLESLVAAMLTSGSPAVLPFGAALARVRW